jgi:hypothetical protein
MSLHAARLVMPRALRAARAAVTTSVATTSPRADRLSLSLWSDFHFVSTPATTPEPLLRRSSLACSYSVVVACAGLFHARYLFAQLRPLLVRKRRTSQPRRLLAPSSLPFGLHPFLFLLLSQHPGGLGNLSGAWAGSLDVSLPLWRRTSRYIRRWLWSDWSHPLPDFPPDPASSPYLGLPPVLH